MRGIGSRVKGHTSVKQYAGGPVRKLTPNRSVLTPSPLTRSGKLNLNNIFPRDAVLLKDFSQGLLAWGIPPAKPSFISIAKIFVRFAGMTEKTVGMAASSLWKCGRRSFFWAIFCDRIALRCCKFALAWAIPIHYAYHCRRKGESQRRLNRQCTRCGLALLRCKIRFQVIMGLDTRKREVELILERLVPRVIHELLDPQSHRDTDQLYRRAVGLVVKALLSQVEPDEAPGPLPARSMVLHRLRKWHNKSGR